MAIKYQSSKFAFHTEGESLTEAEHADSCDINRMIASAHRGLQVRGGSAPQYGYDDTTMDGLRFRIEKAKLEEELSETAKANEFLEEELNRIPEKIRKKFGFKAKKAEQKPGPQNDELNDEKKAVTPPEQQKPVKSETKPAE